MVESEQERPPLTSYEDLARRLDYTLVRPDLSDEEIHAGLQTARQYGVAAVTVRPSDADTAVRVLEGSGVAVAAVVGFPHGGTTTAAKLYEARDLLRRGVKEIEAVLNIGKMLSRQFQYVEMELLQLAQSCRENGAVLKVNLEVGYLADDLKTIACKICKRVEADFAVTSTCYGPRGFQMSDLALLRARLAGRVKIKAQGGVRTVEKALESYGAGCERLGTTTIVTVLEDWKAHLQKLAEERKASGAAPVS